MPTFNHEKFIVNTIRSVINQKYQNWELVILDDASTDHTGDLILQYAKKEKRIKSIRHKNRWGIDKLDHTYNQGLMISRGTLVAILEGDDSWPSYKLSRQVDAFRDKNVVLSYGDAVITRSNGQPVDIISYRDRYDLLCNVPVGSILTKFADINFYLEAVTVMVRRQSLLNIGGFQKDSQYPFVDFTTWINLSLMGKFTYIPEILGYYRRHSESSWFLAAKNSSAMLREELLKTYWSFIDRNVDSIMEELYINKQEIMRSQNKNLNRKSKRKKVSIFLHFILFGDTRNIFRSGSIALKDDNVNMFIKVLIVACLLIGSNLGLLLSVRFYMKKIIYIAEKFVRKYEYLVYS